MWVIIAPIALGLASASRRVRSVRERYSLQLRTAQGAAGSLLAFVTALDAERDDEPGLCAWRQMGPRVDDARPVPRSRCPR